MRFIFKFLLVAVLVFSVVFVVKLLIDNWLYRLSHPFLLLFCLPLGLLVSGVGCDSDKSGGV